ncbi:hypothetical protein [Fodinibius halophilus]|uniref:hypothetical protein n=1 Tax=Fodinibius halophilus TaxID=1736908 RepID=UPI00197AAB14|nr:hypothetical protein [Fodinibius halophilus]
MSIKQTINEHTKNLFSEVLKMIQHYINLALAYLEKGIEIAGSQLLTYEGMIGLFFGLFLVGLVSKIRSH